MNKLFETDYVIYDSKKDHVICFNLDDYIVIYGSKEEAEIDREGTEEVIKCTDLPRHQKERLLKQINYDTK